MSWVRSRRNVIALLALPVLSGTLTAAPHERWVPHGLLSPYDETPFREWTLLGAALLLGSLALLALGTWHARRAPRIRIEALCPASTGPTLMRIATRPCRPCRLWEQPSSQPICAESSAWKRPSSRR